MQKLPNAIPTCISCSQGGYIVAIGYTDEKVRIIDMRARGDKPAEFEMHSQHSDIIKCLSLSPDGMVCLSAGSDCTLKVWEVSSRKCIKTNQADPGVQRKFS
jgi:WD40 repeat protein